MKRSKDIMITLRGTQVGDIEVCPSVDTIKRFDEEQYDHLFYIDPEQHCMSLLFLGKVGLNMLADCGVPEAFHDTLYDSVEDAYTEWEIGLMEACEEWSADD